MKPFLEGAGTWRRQMLCRFTDRNIAVEDKEAADAALRAWRGGPLIVAGSLEKVMYAAFAVHRIASVAMALDGAGVLDEDKSAAKAALCEWRGGPPIREVSLDRIMPAAFAAHRISSFSARRTQ